MERFRVSSSSEKSRHIDTASDSDFYSIYGSDVESLTGYESDEESLIPLTSHAKSPSAISPSKQPQTSFCVVCGVKPQFSKGGKHYPTCGLTCASKLETNGGSTSSTSMCVVCRVRPSYSKGGKKYPTCGLSCADKLKANNKSKANTGSSPAGSSNSTDGSRLMCVICGVLPSYSKGGKNYPTCSLSCADRLKLNQKSKANSGSGSTGGSRLMCVVCSNRPSYSNGTKRYPTCGLTCAEKLAFGGGPHNVCEYCHRKPKLKNYPHCGAQCRDNARVACLICRSRPKNGKYHFCGRTCKDIAMKITPLLVEARPGHVTFEMVETKFKKAWKASPPCPQVKRVYKIVESSTFLRPYDSISEHGNGSSAIMELAASAALEVMARRNYATLPHVRRAAFSGRRSTFGQGIYTSSASNKSASYSPNGIMFLNKVVLGKVHNVGQFEAVKSCPSGSNSVVFDRMNGTLNETIVYRNDAIRPVFLIVFG